MARHLSTTRTFIVVAALRLASVACPHSADSVGLGGTCQWANASACVRNTSQCVVLPTGGASVDCGPAHQQCAQPFASAPRFHIMDRSGCGMNDPNGPFYDELHGMYHVFWQDHLALPRGGRGHGSIWGHAASKDLATWTMLPVALWNDRDWDDTALFTGSATIVDGNPVLMYPGMTQTYPGGDNLAIATPANRSDPLLKEWVKPSSGPMVNHTHADPTSAWRTEWGEWRLHDKSGQVYATQDPRFVSGFVRVPNYTIPNTGECSSLFPLPRCTPGAVCNATTAQPGPTHVHKHSTYADRTYRLRIDQMIVGTLTEAPPGKPGTWTSQGRHQEIDRTFYCTLSTH